MNKLYYGDNLDILRRYIADESVDLIYLDPPFNSKRDYNAVFTGKGGQKAAAQVQAFEDTWRWDDSAARAYDELVIQGTHAGAANCLKAFRSMLGTNDMLAYLSMMAVRLVELRRVLKPTGSIYLHCDPTMSHYLKVLMDSVFGSKFYRNEIIWQRTTNTGSSKAVARKFSADTDTILYYTKSDQYIFNKLYREYGEGYLERFKYQDENGFYRWSALKTYSQERYDDWMAKGLIRHGPNARYPEFKQYLHTLKGVPMNNLWNDIFHINPMSSEKLGYPTQKPIALLERILQASSNDDSVVLDPFCGCGTTVAAAQKMGRAWIGIDITHLAVNLIRTRLIDAFGESIRSSFSVVGEPTTLEDAISLAEADKYQFQFWSLGLVGARPEASDEKKGADKGIDGKRFFSDEVKGKTKTIIISVKGGKNIPPTAVRDLRGTIEREEAEIGVLISIAEPTKNMREDAAAAGFYESPMGTKHRRIQLLTIEQLLEGKTIDMPSGAQLRTDVETTKKAKRVQSGSKQEGLGL